MKLFQLAQFWLRLLWFAQTFIIYANLNETFPICPDGSNCTQVWPFRSREKHVSCRALQSYNSSGDWARQLFKPSTDSASLVVEIEKKIFCFRWGFFGDERHKWGCFWLHLPGPGPQPIGTLLCLNIFSETRPKSASLEPLNDFLAYQIGRASCRERV